MCTAQRSHWPRHGWQLLSMRPTAKPQRAAARDTSAAAADASKRPLLIGKPTALHSLLATLAISLLLAACGSPSKPAAAVPETEAQRLARWAAAPWPPQPLPGSNPNTPRERLPYFWPYPEVPPPKWPEAHPDAKPDRGMSRFEYWNKLCRLEAGEFIYKRVTDVEGYYIVRPRVNYFSMFAGAVSSDFLITNVYAIEDPFGTDTDITLNLLSFP